MTRKATTPSIRSDAAPPNTPMNKQRSHNPSITKRASNKQGSVPPAITPVLLLPPPPEPTPVPVGSEPKPDGVRVEVELLPPLTVVTTVVGVPVEVELLGILISSGSPIQRPRQKTRPSVGQEIKLTTDGPSRRIVVGPFRESLGSRCDVRPCSSSGGGEGRYVTYRNIVECPSRDCSSQRNVVDIP